MEGQGESERERRERERERMREREREGEREKDRTVEGQGESEMYLNHYVHRVDKDKKPFVDLRSFKFSLSDVRITKFGKPAPRTAQLISEHVVKTETKLGKRPQKSAFITFGGKNFGPMKSVPI